MSDIILGIDLGKKIGIAKAHASLKIALPYKTVYKFSDLVYEIQSLSPLYLVVGWPLLLSGEEGLQCRRVKSMLGNLRYLLGDIKIVLEDERFSSNMVIGSKDEDASSAAWFLQNYLNKIS